MKLYCLICYTRIVGSINSFLFGDTEINGRTYIKDISEYRQLVPIPIVSENGLENDAQ